MSQFVFRVMSAAFIFSALLILQPVNSPIAYGADCCCDCSCCCDQGDEGHCPADWVTEELSRYGGKKWTNEHDPTDDFYTALRFSSLRDTIAKLAALDQDVYLGYTDDGTDVEIFGLVAVPVSKTGNNPDTLKQCVPPEEPPGIPCFGTDWIGLIDPTSSHFHNDGHRYWCVKEASPSGTIPARKACLRDENDDQIIGNDRGVGKDTQGNWIVCSSNCVSACGHCP